ncbi:hypothetical protein K2P97_03830 [bacterium]|nr:hypothetical protein [bacterium]
MKTLSVVFLLLLSQISSAAIKFSAYDLRHQEAIEKAIIGNCGVNGVIIQLSSLESPIKVDQGIIDFNYVTEIMVRQGVDQYQFDEYPVTVYSSYSDNYDHSTQNWGVYHVTKVVCQ